MYSGSFGLGFVAASLGPFLCMLLMALVGGGLQLQDWPFILLIAIFAIPASIAAMLVLGLPLVLWLRSRELLSWASVCLGAALSGAFFAPVLAFLNGESGSALETGVFLFGAMFGLIGGVFFCFGVWPTRWFIPPAFRR